jgi:hypothetical protein
MTTNNDISRDVGLIQGEMRAVQDSLDRIERTVTAIEQRLRELEAKENQRKGAVAFLMVIAGAVGGALVKLATYLMAPGH